MFFRLDSSFYCRSLFCFQEAPAFETVEEEPEVEEAEEEVKEEEVEEPVDLGESGMDDLLGKLDEL